MRQVRVRRRARVRRAVLGAVLLVSTLAVGARAAEAAPPLSPTVVARGLGRVADVTTGLDGNVWFIDSVHNLIGRMTPAGDVTYLPSTLPGGALGVISPVAITTGPDGNVWFANTGGSIGRYTTAGVLTTFFDDDFTETSYDLAAGWDGNVWFTNRDSNSVGHITPAGVMVKHTALGINLPVGIALGRDHSMWFANRGGGTIGRITPAGVVTTFPATGITLPNRVAAAPDNAIWFTGSGNKVGRLLNGAVQTFDLGVGGAASDITEGPDGNLWLSDFSHGRVGRLTTAGAVSYFSDPRITAPNRLAPGPDGNVWFGDANRGVVGRITPAGAIDVLAGNGIVNPMGIAAGPDGNLWFVNHDAGTVGRITPAGVVTTFAGPGIDRPWRIASGPDGNLWFTNENDTIGRITPAGVVSTFSGIGIKGPQGITGGPDGNVWFTNRDNDSIGRITPAGVVTNYTAASVKGPHGIAAGPDGKLWFTNAEGTSIGRITTAGVINAFANAAISAPTDIVAGPDGRMWFTNTGGTSVGRMTMLGAVKTFPLPDLTMATHLAAGPDGNLWVTSSSDSGTTYFFRVTPTGTVSPFGFLGKDAFVTAGPGGTLWFTTTDHLVLNLQPVASFGDVPLGPFFDDITWLVGQGITKPFGDGLFHPTDAVSRQAMAAFLYRYRGSPNGPDPTCREAPFDDVPVDSPFCGHIQWAAGAGIVTGDLGGTFRPTAPVSRQAMATFLYRAAGNPNGPNPTCAEPPFPDVSIRSPFCGQIAWLVATGVAAGFGDGTFRPVASVSRQAMAAFIHRLYRLSPTPDPA